MARGGGFGLDAELAAQRDAKYDRTLEANVRQWIEAVLGEPFPDPSFAASLKDGQILCRFINTIQPGTVKKIETSKMVFKQMENVTNFIRGCRGLGVPEPVSRTSTTKIHIRQPLTQNLILSMCVSVSV